VANTQWIAGLSGWWVPWPHQVLRTQELKGGSWNIRLVKAFKFLNYVRAAQLRHACMCLWVCECACICIYVCMTYTHIRLCLNDKYTCIHEHTYVGVRLNSQIYLRKNNISCRLKQPPPPNKRLDLKSSCASFCFNVSQPSDLPRWIHSNDWIRLKETERVCILLVRAHTHTRIHTHTNTHTHIHRHQNTHAGKPWNGPGTF